MPEATPDLVLRGYSDDLIDVSGAITEEWGIIPDAASIVAFSNGTAARVADADRELASRVSPPPNQETP